MIPLNDLVDPLKVSEIAVDVDINLLKCLSQRCGNSAWMKKVFDKENELHMNENEVLFESINDWRRFSTTEVVQQQPRLLNNNNNNFLFLVSNECRWKEMATVRFVPSVTVSFPVRLMVICWCVARLFLECRIGNRSCFPGLKTRAHLMRIAVKWKTLALGQMK